MRERVKRIRKEERERERVKRIRKRERIER